MSEENLEIVRRMVDAWNRRDVETMISLADPEIVYVNAPTAVEPGTRSGHEGFAAVVRAQWEFAPGGELEIERFYDRGETIFTLARIVRPMAGSDQALETQGLASWTIRDGKAVRMEVLAGGPAEVPAALEAAGLAE